MLDENEFTFLFDPKVEEQLRISTSSTTDSNDNSQWQNENFEVPCTHEIESPLDFSNSSQWLQLLDPSQSLGLFTPMTEEQNERYFAMKPKLERVLEILESKLSTVSVKDDCSSQPSSVKLAMPSNSHLLNRRRALTIV
ncbi:unnamed protein product [Blepharisma stoltei]|uniref:Uncharacterized protein n=1 Tax=Blepharisma stoltei TaxID=1481888 RepID=A0AAU9IMF0_9CILI|nr:unnamed protein product [Blepharisma stoltei]